MTFAPIVRGAKAFPYCLFWARALIAREAHRREVECHGGQRQQRGEARPRARAQRLGGSLTSHSRRGRRWLHQVPVRRLPRLRHALLGRTDQNVAFRQFERHSRFWVAPYGKFRDGAVGEHAVRHGHWVPVQAELVQLEQLEGADVAIAEQRETPRPRAIARLRRQRGHCQTARERAWRACYVVLKSDVHIVQLQLYNLFLYIKVLNS